MSLLFDVAFAVIFARAYAECVAALIQFIDPAENMIFSFWGRWLNEKASDMEAKGKSAFWLKPLGLCGICFGIWCGIAGALWLSWFLQTSFVVCFVICVGSVWKWSFD